MDNNVIRILSQLPLFATLPPDAVAAMADIMVPGELSDGDALFHKGDPSGALFLITSGAVKVILDDAELGEQILRQLGPGEALGEMSLIDETPRTATVVALSPIKYLVLHHQDFIDIV